VDVYFENKKKLDTLTQSYKNSHPSMKVVRFYSNDIGINSSSHEILQYMFEPGTQFNIRVSESFRHMMESSGQEINHPEMVSNPFKIVETMMKDSTHPFKAFKDYMSYYNKSLRFVKLNMMLDSHCAGNMSDNLLNLYRFRGNPSFILMDVERKDFTEEESNFLTEISMGELDQYPLQSSSVVDIGVMDTPIVYSMKLIKRFYKEWTDSRMVRSQKCFFFENKKKEIKMWTTFSCSTLCVTYEMENHWYVFSDKTTVDEVENSRMFNLVEREMAYLSSKGFSNICMTNQNVLKKSELRFDFMNMMFCPSIYFKELKWTINIEFLFQVDNNNEDIFKNKFRLYSDTYTMDRKKLMGLEMDEDGDYLLEDLLRESVGIHQLDDMFLEKGWIKDKFLVWKSEKNTKENMKDIQDYNESFGNMGLLETVGSVMSSNKNITEEQEEIGEDTEYMKDVSILVGEEMMESARKMAEMMRNISKEIDHEDEGINIRDRVSVIKTMDRIVNDTFKQSTDIDIIVFKKMYKSCKKANKMDDCHSMIIKCIEDYYDEEISDGMIMILYNIIIKRMSHLVQITPYNDLKKLKMDNMPNMFKFIKSKKEILEMEEFFENL
jgi:hypothetical protein